MSILFTQLFFHIVHLYILECTSQIGAEISSLRPSLPRHQIPTRRHELQHENIRISPGETTCASCTTGKIWCHRMSVAMLKKHLAPSHLPCRTWRADPTVAATLPATSPAKIPGAGPWGQTVVCLPVCIWVGDADNSCSRDVVVCIHYLPRMSSRQWHE